MVDAPSVVNDGDAQEIVNRLGVKADMIVQELGWDEERTTSEIQHYLNRVQAEIESQQMTEDELADAERTEATDIRVLAKG